MARLCPRIASSIPVEVDARHIRTEGVVTNLGMNGAFLIPDKKLTGDHDNVLLKYNLSEYGDFEHSGKIIRKDRSGYALKFYDLDIAAKVKLWKYVADNLAGIEQCPYCGERYNMLPESCNACGWELTFNSPEYFAYHEKQSLIKKLYSEVSGLNADHLQRLINFMEVEILKVVGSEKFQEFVGTSSVMLEVFSKIRKVAPTDLPALILGESGTGKELTALAIHERSQRKDKPFVTINCAAIPESLLEAELFGYERGAFTGAYTSKKGKFECADGGTIFLDEIGDMPLSLQSKLLRFLQDRVIERIGSIKGKKVDVRLIAATNCDLNAAIGEGRFRNDLYYRLNAFTINLPPVRERGEDRVILAKHFLNKISMEMGLTKTFTGEAIEAVRAYTWPGNVREMINKIRRAIVMAEANSISPRDLDLAAQQTMDVSENTGLRDAIGKIEMQKIKETLNACGNNISMAARLLGVSRQSLYNYKRKYGI
ncbi:MAG: sigma 54-interacting transcriptional regulator [Nitrospiraceae bacterium]|nr:sigma 54-interacting transcriptional regulator [Nitrospiraceae bacterium]